MPYFGVPIRNGLPIGLGTLTALAQAVAVVVPPPVSTDPYFEYVSLLANTTSTNGAQNNTFLDGSTNAFSITRNGNTTQGTFSPFSQTGWSNYFDGTGDNLSAASNAAFDILSGGDFTVECWFYANALSDNAGFGCALVSRENSAGSAGFIFRVKPDRLEFVYPGLSGNVQLFTFVTNTWYHVAAVRSSGTMRYYINGTQYSPTYADRTTDATVSLLVGASGFSGNSAPFTGYVSNLRIVKGTAVYTAAFTPPTAPLTNITNTSLLTCQSNRFIDNSSNAFAITRNGDVSVQAFSPFNPTAAWDASTNGGSGYFDGTGDYLTAAMTALSFGTGNFTIEGWVYRLDTNTRGVFQLSSTAGGLQASTTNTLSLGSDAGQVWRIYANGTAYNSTATWVTGAWYHFALVRNSGTTTLYINGTSVISQADTTNYTGVNIAVSGFFDTTFLMNGYISGVRVLTGTAQYTANFTPPTAPLTNITNTSLLCNFTNAGIFDSASGNDLETVGNAQVSTTVAKFGTTSMAFDGTGDWLVVPDRPPLRFGSGDFTVEMWLYKTGGLPPGGIIGKGTSTTGWALTWQTGNTLEFTFGSTSTTSVATISNDTWYHLALVRSGSATGNVKLYLDGTLIATSGTAVTDNLNQTNVMYVGADRTGANAFTGYIDELRITNGYARYTANFTPPTAAFPLN